jgi:glycosyltransferase 2 family protein
VLLVFVLFSRRARGPLARYVGVLRMLRLERPLRAAYEGLHGYRSHGRLLAWSFALTTAVQVFRVLGIWLVARAVGVHLSPRPFFVLGPLLFLVMLVPFTVNGLAVREAFFVSFLGTLHVPADPAFATGFLFYLLSIASAIPGAILLMAGALSVRRKDMSAQIRT